jgi:hypothetical protein
MEIGGAGMRYELVVEWYDGEKEVYGYKTEAEAKKAGEQYYECYGEQVSVKVRRVVCG